jgi:elongation factor P
MYDDERPISVLARTGGSHHRGSRRRGEGQTASSSYKPAVLDNGVRILVPPHIAAARASW